MAAALGAGMPYSPPTPVDFSYADTTSSVYPDRPIRPLPKRRLRSRLSPEVAESILYPLEGSPTKVLFHDPYEAASRKAGALQNADTPKIRSSSAEKEIGNDAGKDSYQFKGNDTGSDDDDSIVVTRRYQEPHQRTGVVNIISSRNGHVYSRNEASKLTKPPMPQSTGSSGDSIDGYDSFENTNNKKKRKVPMSGSLGSHQSSLAAEMAQMGISSTRDIDVTYAEADGGVGHYYGTGSSAKPSTSAGNGISGAGRGRYGKAGPKNYSGRSPLGVSTNGSNAPTSSRALLPRGARQLSGSSGAKDFTSIPTSDQGIISAAIANAAAIPTTPIRGQENISLLQQQSTKQPSSTKEQFTFTCESESARSIAWPEIHSPPPNAEYQEEIPYGTRPRVSPNSRGFATQGTQTSPNMGNTVGQLGDAASAQPGIDQQAPPQVSKPRRPLAKQYAIAARERRRKQEYSNYYHPPKQEDIWICEFCEYESIFGTPPTALIQQYEGKDRRERIRLAEKRRLLEKAKMKGRKGKKGSKNAAKNSVPATQPQQAAPKGRYDLQPVENLRVQNQGTANEEYVVDDYDNDPLPTLPLPTPSQIPQPVAQTRIQSLRPPSGSGSVGAPSTIDRRIPV